MLSKNTGFMSWRMRALNNYIQPIEYLSTASNLQKTVRTTSLPAKFWRADFKSLRLVLLFAKTQISVLNISL